MTRRRSSSKSDPIVGRRIELVYTDDEYTLLRPGARGRVTGSKPDAGRIDVKWDDGSTLSLIDGHDHYRLL